MKPAWPLVCACLVFLSVALWCLRNIIKEASRNDLTGPDLDSAHALTMNLILTVLLLSGAVIMCLAAVHRLFLTN